MVKLANLYFLTLKAVMALLLAAMCVMVFGNVVLRYLFNQGLTASDELSRLFFVWLTFVGAAVAIRERGHIGVDMLVRRLPPRGARLCLVLAHGLMLWVVWLMLQGSWKQAMINLNVASPTLGFSMSLFYFAGVFFAATGAVLIAVDTVNLALGRTAVNSLFLSDDPEALAVETDAANDPRPTDAAKPLSERS
jgi:TRAP-type C4-dicarboxylate transport system permease small subunit